MNRLDNYIDDFGNLQRNGMNRICSILPLVEPNNSMMCKSCVLRSNLDSEYSNDIELDSTLDETTDASKAVIVNLLGRYMRKRKRNGKQREELLSKRSCIILFD